MKYLAIIITIWTLNLYGQKVETKLNTVRISYQKTLTSLPEIYEINLTKREIDYISPTLKFPPEKETKVTKKLTTEKWNEMKGFVSEINFDLLKSSTESNVKESWFSINLTYSNGKSKTIKIEKKTAPKTLIELNNFVQNNK